MFQVSDSAKIGTLLVFLGVGFLMLGVMLFFDSALLALGNIMFLVGFTLLTGPGRTIVFFSKADRRRGVLCFIGGVALVLMGWPIIGMFVETFGFLNLFGSFFPIALGFARRIPYLGDFLNMPGVASIADKIAGGTAKATEKSHPSNYCT